MRQCTAEYKIDPVKRKVRELLGYEEAARKTYELSGKQTI